MNKKKWQSATVIRVYKLYFTENVWTYTGQTYAIQSSVLKAGMCYNCKYPLAEKLKVSYFRSEYFKISINPTTLTLYTSTVTMKTTSISPLFASAESPYQCWRHGQNSGQSSFWTDNSSDSALPGYYEGSALVFLVATWQSKSHVSLHICNTISSKVSVATVL